MCVETVAGAKAAAVTTGCIKTALGAACLTGPAAPVAIAAVGIAALFMVLASEPQKKLN
jgi:hypothetical protein